MNSTFVISLLIMAQGMAGIFLVVILITLMVMLMGKFLK